MIECAHGLILRVRPFTETSLIVHWLTAEFGRLHTVARGARRAKSPFRGKLDLFYEADLSFVRNRRSELHTLREVRLQRLHTVFRQDLGRLQQVSYCATLLEQATETDTPLPGAFALMAGLVETLSTSPPMPHLELAFELKLLKELGLNPALKSGSLSPGARRIAAKCVELDWPALPRLKLTPVQRQEISRYLQGFLLYHLGRFPRGRSAACDASREGTE